MHYCTIPIIRIDFSLILQQLLRFQSASVLFFTSHPHSQPGNPCSNLSSQADELYFKVRAGRKRGVRKPNLARLEGCSDPGVSREQSNNTRKWPLGSPVREAKGVSKNALTRVRGVGFWRTVHGGVPLAVTLGEVEVQAVRQEFAKEQGELDSQRVAECADREEKGELRCSQIANGGIGCLAESKWVFLK